METKDQFEPEVWQYLLDAIASGKAIIMVNQPYMAHIQKISDLVAQGITEIYNPFENTVESLIDENGKPKEGFVITGAAGEQWCIKAKNLAKYGISTEPNPPEGMISVNDIPPEGMNVMTQPDGILMIAVPTTKEMQGAVKTSWASLNFNAPETTDGKPIPHGKGDYILIPAIINPETKEVDIDRKCADARVVNGSIMNILYREVSPAILEQAATIAKLGQHIAELEQQKQKLDTMLEMIENSGGTANISAEKFSERKDQYNELSKQLEKEKEQLATEKGKMIASIISEQKSEKAEPGYSVDKATPEQPKEPEKPRVTDKGKELG